MKIFKKIFGGKEKDVSIDLNELLEANDISVSFGEDNAEFKDEDYKYNHLFICYLIEDGMFEPIEAQFRDSDVPNCLSVLCKQEDVFIIDSGIIKRGNKISAEDGIDSAIANFKSDERFSSESGKKFLEILNNNKSAIQNRLKGVIENTGDHFDDDFDYESFEVQVDTIPMMFIFFKSTKPFEPSDTQSESRGHLNVEMTSRNGFIRSLMFAASDAATNEINKKNWDENLTGTISYYDANNKEWFVEELNKDVAWLDSETRQVVIQI